MALSATEINFRRLLEAAPLQRNQNKLMHYVATLREQLEQISEERTPEGLPKVSKSALNDYSDKIELIASKIAPPSVEVHEEEEPFPTVSIKKTSKFEEGPRSPSSPGLRRRHVSAFSAEHRTDYSEETVKLDGAAQAHIDKHRKLQDDLTDEMVGLAQQLKEGSLMMSQSLKNTEKILDSTEKAVEHSLASTGHANARTMEISSQSFKTTCFTWLLMFAMTCIFVMVVLLIRIT